MNTNNPNFGVFDFDDKIDSDYATMKRVYGRKPKINKDPELLYESFAIDSYSDVAGRQGYRKKKFVGIDNARDIFKKIEDCKKDIEKYKNIGIIETSNGYEINFYKVAINTEKELEELYEYL